MNSNETGTPPERRPVGPLGQGWFRLRPKRLGTKLILFSTLLTLITVSSAFLALSLEIRRDTKRLLEDTLSQHQRTIVNLEKRNLGQLIWLSSLMTGSPMLRAAMETYQQETVLGSSKRADLLATIQNEVEKIAKGLGRDLLIVTDDEGKVLAASGRDSITPDIGKDLSSLTILQRALDPTAPIGDQSHAVLKIRGQYVRVGCVPIVLQGTIIGTLALGDLLDEPFIRSLRELFGGDIILAAGSRVIGSTLPDPSPAIAGLEGPPSSGNRPSSARTSVRLAGEDYLVAPLPLGSEGNDRVTLYLLHSLTGALERPNRSLLLMLIWYASLTASLGGLGAWAVSRSILHPLEGFVAFMRSVAGTGDPSLRFDASRAGHEVQTLNATYTRLIESLVRERKLLLDAREDLSHLERLKDSEKMAALGRLLSGAAHEINNPLTGVLGNLELLLADSGLDGKVRLRIEKIQREGQRIMALVRNLLKISHRHRGERKIIDVCQVIRDSVGLRRHDFTASGMSLKLDLASDKICVFGNDLEFQQVFLIIIGNAFDALKEARLDPTLTIGAHASGDQAILTFTDNGPGMESPQNVFEPFYTTKEVGQGTGLGLTIAHAIIRDNGGQIMAEKVPDGGARITLVLPAVAAKEAGEARRPVAAAPTPASPLSASVLVVDDEPSVMSLQVEILRSLGAEVVGVSSGTEAIELLRQQEFDLIVSDLKMPGGVSGADLFRWAQANHPDAARHFLFVTGDTVAESTHNFVETAQRPCLLKPFSTQEYISAVMESLHALRPAS